MTSQIVEEQTDFVEKQIRLFEKDFVVMHPGDSGMGGNDPQEPVYEVQAGPSDMRNFLRSFASTLIERVGSELIGEDEQHESGSNTMDDEKVTRNDFRASQRTKLREMR